MQEPMQTAVPKLYQDVARQLAESESMHRLAGFQNREEEHLCSVAHVCSTSDNMLAEAFQAYFPKTHGFYSESLSKLYDQCRHLRRPYVTSIMPAAAFNLGPVTVCRPHRDSANLSYGICSITALGNFNPKVSGHLILHELRLAIEFPPGSTVLIPSAILTHSNTRIQPGETRYSFTQYAAGSLFSYIENGMVSKREVMESLPKTAANAMKHMEASEGNRRWQNGLEMFPNINEYQMLDSA